MTKLQNLKNEIKKLDNIAVAFSGGVDSSLLLKVAHDVLKDKSIAITIRSPYMSEREINETVEFTEMYGIQHEIMQVGIIDEITTNPENRCYICKMAVFTKLIEKANKLGFTNIADGTNKDDLDEYRPGLKAKSELGVISPLINLSKNEIRDLSRRLKLNTYNKPSYACLLTRLPHNYKFNKNELSLIEKIENFLITNSYKNIRARFDGKYVKLQMGVADMARFITDIKFKEMIKVINSMGKFELVLDLKGLREDVLK
ncbi:ATP-dependent sacrificial sulfur transferase LarE [Campylobacter sp. faydin G-24]|uniref:ATP-dependent sacrificial sulfur transferase LarE n=1 Tax=Campylobacter anatolicus TaxID=2829105 RepID=A0ABS5HH43_9BACT|nr:ATP-dependent sacrificial sulfur transferase LarE [Campylobacter anatolicus]MBR8463598.1 ATP-dependent sacrificial sulfur transferase LarE [Campylobacter anatolicus]